MKMTMSILLASDGSPEALAATEWLDRWADPDRVEVSLITVISEPTLNWEVGAGGYVLEPDVYEKTLQEVFDESRSRATAILQKTREQMTRCTPAHQEVLTGAAPFAIVEYAKKHHIDLIVMGRRGHSALGNLMGSVSFGVLNRSPIPVTIVS